MTRYSHPDFDGLFPRPKGQFVTINGRQIGSAFFATAKPQEIEALGFVEYVPTLTPEQIIEGFRRAIQAHVDATARSRQYDNGVSLASYVNSTNPQWAAEATSFVAWRDAVWAYAYTELDKVLNEEREQPTIEDFLNELPAISWPE